MSHTYIAEIKSSKTIIDSNTSPDLSKMVTWANSNSIVGDLIVVSEGYLCSDGVLHKHDLINSWYNNDD